MPAHTKLCRLLHTVFLTPLHAVLLAPPPPPAYIQMAPFTAD
jgi:hypothetical protein